KGGTTNPSGFGSAIWLDSVSRQAATESVQTSFDEELLHGTYVVAQAVFARAIASSPRLSLVCSMRSYSMVFTLRHKLFLQGQSGAQRGDRRAGVRERLVQKPLLESLEDRTLPSLIAPIVYDTGTGTQALAVGDLRGNGRLDIVTANNSSVSVLLGNGD